MFEDFGGRPFAFEPSNDYWRKTRNQFSDVFHKYKMEYVLKIVKEQTNKAVEEWMGQINKNGSTTIDLAIIVERLLLQSYLIVAFGKDLTGK